MEYPSVFSWLIVEVMSRLFVIQIKNSLGRTCTEGGLHM